ncbi:hypothetical protein CANINC_003906 [Pichia inconspicua]|uniref:Cytochrome b5 heme-binding domain-containing protein n=1 Tax=Pichia inconspicua TaxID=52247 RepID=A0A4T0WXF1_9ASCO|nr:hypothetical protein CANINC_003906 [[Candida] inconspicua]
MSTKSFTAEQVAEHNTRDDIWIIYNGKVYDVTQYLDEHPGGEEVILDCAGDDATEAFDDIGHSEDAHEQLESLLIGELIGGVKPKSASSDSSSGSGSDPNLALYAVIIAIIAAAAYFYLNQS